MNFGRVYGRATASSVCEAGCLRIEVSLETGSTISIVRDECVALPGALSADQDVGWWADQFTQETIGTVLAEQGWEAFALADADSGRASVDPATVTYVVRRL